MNWAQSKTVNIVKELTKHLFSQRFFELLGFTHFYLDENLFDIFHLNN